MRYLVKLLRPPNGGIVLDPFMGSGTTGMAAILEDMDFIGMENVEEYKKIADQRIEFVRQNKELILKEGLKPEIIKKVKPKDSGSGLERVFE
jgi:site-specific DNA-methyltransferase (adenine-specific)